LYNVFFLISTNLLQRDIRISFSIHTCICYDIDFESPKQAFQILLSKIDGL